MKHRTSPFLLFPALALAASPSIAAAQSAATATTLQRPEVHPADGVDGGATPEIDCRSMSDEVPLPVASVRAPANGVDIVVTPASGDPNFLAFVGGRYYPPAGESIDPRLLASAATESTDGRPDSSTYAFVMFSKRITPERTAQLARLGCRTLGFHPHYTIKVALPVASIDAVAALDFVRWVGLPTSAQKVHPRLNEELARTPAGNSLEVYIDVYESDLCAASSFTRVGTQQTSSPNHVRDTDAGQPLGGEVWMSNGWQQHVLEQNGVEVLEYVDRIHAFRARILAGALEPLVGLDFVQFVEYAPPHELDHDESMPMIGSDYVRAIFDGNDSLNTIAGAIDSGLDIDHEALDHLVAVGWDMSSDHDVFQDDCEHGSHVIGTLLGSPPASLAALTGGAPGLGRAADLRFRIVKFLDGSAGSCNGQGSMSTAFSHMRGDFTDGNGVVSPKPHVINCSFSSAPTAGSPWFGSESDPRTIDAEVWDNEQFYCFGAGNSGLTVGNQSIGDNGTAKNAFTTGAVIDMKDTTLAEPTPGNLAGFSSVGPCGDGRWKPNATAPGQKILSVDANSGNGYVFKQGTSTANPHVTGIAAQLCDHYPSLRYAPHRIASLLMATAMTDGDQLLTQPSTSSTDHLNTFGAGRVNAARANFIWGGDSDWINWGTQINANVAAWSDFDVPAGCDRLVVCMTFHEDQCSAGAVPATVNDLDLYLDSPAGGIDPAMNTGEFTAQQSNIDNTEIRILDNPQSGTWRWKVFPENTTSATRFSVTVVKISADTTPTGTISLTANDSYVQPNDDIEFTASAYNPEYFASCVFLDTTSSGDSLQSVSTTLDDGSVADLTDNPSFGRDVLLGTIRPGETRTVTWRTRWATEGQKSWNVTPFSDNWSANALSITSQIIVDGTAPGVVTNLHSTTHTPGVWSNDPTITYAWTAATDNLAGIDGYDISTTALSPVNPGAVKVIEQVTSYNDSLADGSWYFNIRAVDNSGNWSTGFANVGPFKIDTTGPSGPAGLGSTTHTVNVLSCNTAVNVTWTAASDSGSGLLGYIGMWDTIATTTPTGPITISPTATSSGTNIGSSTAARYFHLRAVDNLGNYGVTQHFGPVFANANTVSTYGTGKTNSLGCIPAIGSTGQPSLGAGTFTVTCSNVLNNRSGVMFWGRAAGAVPFQGGTKYIANPVQRTPLQDSGGNAAPANDCSGTYAFTFDAAYMLANGIAVGDTIYCQYWMRDSMSPSTTGLSNALQFTVCQ